MNTILEKYTTQWRTDDSDTGETGWNHLLKLIALKQIRDQTPVENYILASFFFIAWSTCCHVSLQDSCGPVPQTFSQKCNLSITSSVTHISPIGRKREKGECISLNEFPEVFDSRQKKKNCFRFQTETSRIHQDGGKICSDVATRGKLVRCDQPVRSLLEGGGLVAPLGATGKCCFSISF